MTRLYILLLFCAVAGYCSTDSDSSWWTWSPRSMYQLYLKIGCFECIRDLVKQFGVLYSDEYLCMENPIQLCTCYELFYQTKSLSTNLPNIDANDINLRYRIAQKYYHPDHGKEHLKSYAGDQDEPFIFLTQCKEALLSDKQKEKYAKRMSTEIKQCKTLVEKFNLPEVECRKLGIQSANKELIVEYVPSGEDKTQATDANGAHADEISTTLMLFLDNSGSMSGSRLTEAKKIFTMNNKALKKRIVNENTNVYLIGSKGYSKQIIDFENEKIAKSNFDSLITNKWDADGGATYLWEFVWNTVESTVTTMKSGQDCEIVIATDGEDNESPGAFNGVDGFSEVMKRFNKLNVDNKASCRLYVFCFSSECSKETESGKRYRDMAMASNGTFCGPKDADACVGLLTLTHFQRWYIGVFELDTHVKMIRGGETDVKQQDWLEKNVYESFNVLKILPSSDDTHIPVKEEL